MSFAPGIPDATLLNDLKPLAAEWKKLGVELHVPMATMNSIDGQKSMCQDCLMGMIQDWLATNGSTQQGKTGGNIGDAGNWREQACQENLRGQRFT